MALESPVANDGKAACQPACQLAACLGGNGCPLPRRTRRATRDVERTRRRVGPVARRNVGCLDVGRRATGHGAAHAQNAEQPLALLPLVEEQVVGHAAGAVRRDEAAADAERREQHRADVCEEEDGDEGEGRQGQHLLAVAQ